MVRKLSLICIILSFCCLLTSYASTDDSGAATPPEVVVIEINSTINPATLDYIRAGLEKAEERSAQALIIELDTPGGLLSSMKEIVKLLLNSPVPVVVYVSPKGASAASAGAFITLSANIAAMAPGTSIGAAHPVSLTPGGGEQGKKGQGGGENKNGKSTTPQNGGSEKDIMSEKLENYASSFIKSIAEERGRNTKWAVEAVRKSSSITSTEALKIHVIDLIAPNLEELLKDIDGRTVKLPEGDVTLHTANAVITRVEMNAKQRLIDTLSTPDIAFLLLSLGSLGLLLEFYHPGLIFPGVAGAVCLLLGFVSFQILPFNYAGIALLLLGIVLFVAEVYITSYGALTLGGLISFALGALLLFKTPESDVRVGFNVVISSTLAFGLFFAYVIFYLIKAQKLAPQTGLEGMVGKEGTAVSKAGKIFINGEYWDAESEDTIMKGDKVQVVEVLKGFKLKVKKL
jgi:membrane-bound serine protease (ClpP class)